MRPNAWRRTLLLALVALVIVALATAALGAPEPWQQAAARVDFQLYRPTVTSAWGPVVVERCGYGIQWCARATPRIEPRAPVRDPLLGAPA